MSPPSTAGLVVVGHSRPTITDRGTEGASATAAVSTMAAWRLLCVSCDAAQRSERPQSARQTRPTRPQSARETRLQSARQARTFMQPPPVCDVLDGLPASPGDRPHSAGPERHRQHGNADDVWVVETPDQLRAHPPGAPAQTRRPVRVVRHVQPRTVELAIGSAGCRATRSQNNALHTTAVAMGIRRRCAGVLAPAPCSNQPVTWWRDYQPSAAADIASAVKTSQGAVDSVRAHNATATCAARQPKPGPAGFRSRYPRHQSRKLTVHLTSQTGLAGRAFIALRRPVEDGKTAQAE